MNVMDGQREDHGIVILRTCADCKRPASLSLRLLDLPDGTCICENCRRRREQAALRGGGAQQLGTVATQSEPAQAEAQREPAPRGSLYEALNVPFDATAEEITAALSQGFKYWDGLQYGEQRLRAAEMLGKLRDAAVKLKDPVRRQRYDTEEVLPQLRAEQAARAERSVKPLEDWPGQKVTNLKELISTCERSKEYWRIGEGMLKNEALFFWVKYMLKDGDTADFIEELSARQGISEARKLNELLYHIDPERPFRFFAQPDAFDGVRPSDSVTTVAELVTYADAHVDSVTRHLFHGELLTWLSARTTIGEYGGRIYYSVREFFDQVCRPFAGGWLEAVGLEALLHFLDPNLESPALRVTFDNQVSKYDLLGWDGELAHAPVTVSITNTTRGSFGGQVELPALDKKNATDAPWMSFTQLPLERPLTQAAQVAKPAARNSTTPSQTFILKGRETKTFKLYLGNFNVLKPGRVYEQLVAIGQFGRSVTQATPSATFPLRLRLLRFIEGYRAKLWQRGLRGGFPGIALDGGIGALVGLFVAYVGFLSPPRGTWNVLPSDQLTSALPFILNVILVALLRSCYLAFAVLGFWLPVLLGAAFGFCGFTVGLRRGHTKFSAQQDRRRHTVLTRFVVIATLLSTWIIFGAYNNGEQLTYYSTHVGYYPPLWGGFPAFAVIMPAVVAYIAGRIINLVRQRLYRRVAARWQKLLQPA